MLAKTMVFLKVDVKAAEMVASSEKLKVSIKEVQMDEQMAVSTVAGSAVWMVVQWVH